jgi:dihydropteroate synthase
MAGALADLDVIYLAGHLRGATLAEVFAAEAAVSWRDVAADLALRLAALPPHTRARAWIDPGIGFGKGADPEGNLELLRQPARSVVGRAVVVGRAEAVLRLVVRGEPTPLDTPRSPPASGAC